MQVDTACITVYCFRCKANNYREDTETMSLEDLEPFGYEWELEQQERVHGEPPLEGEHSRAHREAAQLGLSCPFDCEPDYYDPEDDYASEADLDAAASRAEDREFGRDPWS